MHNQFTIYTVRSMPRNTNIRNRATRPSNINTATCNKHTSLGIASRLFDQRCLIAPLHHTIVINTRLLRHRKRIRVNHNVSSIAARDKEFCALYITYMFCENICYLRIIPDALYSTTTKKNAAFRRE